MASYPQFTGPGGSLDSSYNYINNSYLTFPPQNQYLQQQQQPPPEISYYHDKVRTLFVGGLPHDVKCREIYNLFRRFPGYCSSHLNKSSDACKSQVAFIVFTDQQSALAAMHALDGLDFDPEKGAVLHIQLAKANSHTKRPRADSRALPCEKRIRASNNFPTRFSEPGVGGIAHMSGMDGSCYSSVGQLVAYQSNEISKADAHSLHCAASPTIEQSAERSVRSNLPCPTLFAANLGPSCTEQELCEVFSRCPGFLKLKISIRGGFPIAFVDFKDVESSSKALNNLQNTLLYSSVHGGMHLEYAKARMGLPRKEKT